MYVGKATDVQKRVRDHFQGKGAALTRADPPIDLLPLLDGRGDELRETLAQMAVHGLNSVRGYRWVHRNLRQGDRRAIIEDMIEQFNLCRRCGRQGHFASQCRSRVLSQNAIQSNATESVAQIVGGQ